MPATTNRNRKNQACSKPDNVIGPSNGKVMYAKSFQVKSILGAARQGQAAGRDEPDHVGDPVPVGAKR